ncbi:MAG TPA: cobalt-precorrin-5B (C(1))-methyltransferase [Methanotrichaceae archaeon]|nr:cobalt-precorrin-5B (C(1))-methyltransferase [Methanotrichaceae archaeon]
MRDPVIDPVMGFEVPEAWLQRTADPEARSKVESGMWVLLSDGKLLRRGLTTGSTAAAVCKGAVISLRRPADRVEVGTPAGIRVFLDVEARDGFCAARKDGGDHQFDITSGIEICAMAEIADRTELLPGRGIGRISRSGLCASIGKAAISQSAHDQIMAAIIEGLKEAGFDGARVELSVPEGESIARKTLNPDLGIKGGISILGSTGFVEPWNDHLGESRALEIRSLDKVVVTTGRSGLKYSRMLFPDHQAVLVGSQLDRLEFRADQESVLCGLPALILRWGWPQLLEGSGYNTVAEMVEREPDHPGIDEALRRVREKLPGTRIVLLLKNGKIFRDLP